MNRYGFLVALIVVLVLAAAALASSADVADACNGTVYIKDGIEWCLEKTR